MTFAAGTALAAGDERGRQIYAEECAYCHGDKGEGVEDVYNFPLEGDTTLATLTAYIDSSMPDGDPEYCVGEDAASVAKFIFKEFYTRPTAPETPPAVPLARLTVSQYRQSLADLLTPENAAVDWGDTRGLRVGYFDGVPRGSVSRQLTLDKKKLLVERTDARVDVDFGTETPAGMQIADEFGEFTIVWEGSLVAPETGTYDLRVETPNSFQLWVNDAAEPLIDAGVRSGDQTEYTASVEMLEGRAHPVRLQFFKRLRKKKVNGKPVLIEKTRPASIRLSWRPPHGEYRPVATHRLLPVSAPPVYVASTSFPPDDRSLGYPRGTFVSEAWDEATTSAAIAAAGFVEEHLDDLIGVAADGPAEKRVREMTAFATDFVRRAFGGTVDDATAAFVTDRVATDGPDGVTMAVLYALKSPRFLYPGIERTPELSANRLAAVLGDSLPDGRATKAAADGRLRKPEVIASEARRMLDDPRTRAKLHRFFASWLEVERDVALSKNEDLFPGFDAAVGHDLRTSLELFLDDVAWGPRPDFRRLIDGSTFYVNDRLAEIYGLDQTGDGFRPVRVDDTPSAGVITHPLVMARHAHERETSPIHRGVFLARRVMGHTLRPPQVDFELIDPELHPDMTMRERVELQTGEVNCMVCHEKINPLGFVLEHFDAVGRFRKADNGRPVDASVDYRTPDGVAVRLDGADDWAALAVESVSVRRTFARQLFEYFAARPPAAYGAATLDRLTERFTANDCDIRELLVEIAVTAAGDTEAERIAMAAAASDDGDPIAVAARP
ncbi:MAG: DUF1592 domain-containing protein [Planctomycetota bacterium]